MRRDAKTLQGADWLSLACTVVTLNNITPYLPLSVLVIIQYRTRRHVRPLVPMLAEAAHRSQILDL